MSDDQMDNQTEIIETFDMFDDWMEKYQYIIDLGKQLPEMDTALKTDDNLLAGCQSLASAAVVVDVVEVDERPEVHDRYAVDAVPMVLLVDTLGVVRDHHLGPVSATHLWGSLAELRQPGSTPDGCDAGH